MLAMSRGWGWAAQTPVVVSRNAAVVVAVAAAVVVAVAAAVVAAVVARQVDAVVGFVHSLVANKADSGTDAFAPLILLRCENSA